MGKKKKGSKSKKSASPAPPLRVDLDAPPEDFSEQLAEMHRHLETQKVCGQAGGGLVKIEMDGMMRILRCQLAPELLEKKDRELIEDLLVSAFNDAAAKMREQVFMFLASTLPDEEDPEGLDEDPDLIEMAKALSENKDFMAQLGDPVVTSFVEMLAALEDLEDDEPPKPKRGRH